MYILYSDDMHLYSLTHQTPQPRNNAVMTGNITTLRFLVDEVGVKTLNSDCKGYSPLQMAVVWGQYLGEIVAALCPFFYSIVSNVFQYFFMSVSKKVHCILYRHILYVGQYLQRLLRLHLIV